MSAEDLRVHEGMEYHTLESVEGSEVIKGTSANGEQPGQPVEGAGHAYAPPSHPINLASVPRPVTTAYYPTPIKPTSPSTSHSKDGSDDTQMVYHTMAPLDMRTTGSGYASQAIEIEPSTVYHVQPPGMQIYFSIQVKLKPVLKAEVTNLTHTRC